MKAEEFLSEDLRKWFKEKWVRFGPDGKIRGDCARGNEKEGKPKCLPQKKAHALGKKGRSQAASRKRREDPNPDRKGKAINVRTKAKENMHEAPIELDRDDPMDPMIYGTGANPAKLKYRMARAAGQLKDLASRVDNASPSEWQRMAQQFEELKMNMEQIRHALEELSKIRKKGGIRSRGITV
jgi:hypothetical protein